MSASVLAAVPMAPRDPILGLTEAFNTDPNPKKVNLGVGVYTAEDGKVPLLECVRRAEQEMAQQHAPRSYLPIDGLAAYDRAVQALVFGENAAACKEGRVVTVQALGGTGGLKVGADFLRRVASAAEVWISDPSWENHRALFEGAGFKVNNYTYYDPRTRGLDFEGMLAALQGIPAGHVVVLHACCHNPTGVDPTPEQWSRIIETVRNRELIPFVDIAYQGFAEGVEPDGAVVRRFAAAGAPLFVSNSFSKSFSLYGERVGALSIVAESADEAARALSQVKRTVRTNYSNPPTHGGRIVAAVLGNAELRAQWEQELGHMRERIRQMRVLLAEKIRARVRNADFSFVTRQRGMFSYTGLSKDQVGKLREQFSIYAVDSGRICVAALNTRNIDYVADAVASVLA
jgi:aromatic-amino-acid transaminase